MKIIMDYITILDSMKSSIILLILISILNVMKCEELFVRKNAKDMTFKDWVDFKEGIKVMKSRNLTNPLGFNFQANIHGWDKYDGSPVANNISDQFNWHKCNHQHYFFLVWHRMYLYFFERILRKATENPLFTIPYWDYSDPQERALPQPFRIPADEEKNPLYTSKRCDIINKGKPLCDKITDPYPALRSRFFAANKDNELNVCHSFGGGRIKNPVFASDRSGLLEQLPHNLIHDYVGGPTGYMSDLCQAARDPIFYLHHAFIDCVWESWLQLRGQNLNEEIYLNQSFNFYDETGRLGTYFVKDFFNLTKLNYRYDSLIKSDIIEPTTNEMPKLYISIEETKNLTINSKKRWITLEIKQKYYTLYDSIAKGKIDETKIRFTFQTVLKQSQSSLIFQLYLNQPENTLPYEDSYNYMGSISLFEPRCIPRKIRKKSLIGINNSFDITENLMKIIRNEYNFNGIVPKYLNLTVVPMSCGTISYPKDEEYIIKFQKTLLIHHYPIVNKNNSSNLFENLFENQ